jgi:phosphomannomutase
MTMRRGISINPKLRRSYDLRGTVGETLTSRDGFGVGIAFASIAAARGLRRIATSRDGRPSSPELEAALIDGLVEGGAEVFRMPLGPTPLVSFAVDRLRLSGGIMVTGSHLPPDQNGFKLQLEGHPMYGEALDDLWSIEPARREGGRVREVDLTEEYVEALIREVEGWPIRSAVWDSGNGATGSIVELLASRVSAEQRAIYTSIDGTFPNHHPDPSVPANVRDVARQVVDHAFDLGIAFDGDGDRIGLVDSTGEIVWADQLILLLARDVLCDQPGAAVVADVKSSDILFSGIEAAGGRAVMSPSGYVLVREAMLREAAPLAGEMSGHIFFADRWHCADDGLYVAVRTLRALARSEQSLREFRESLPPSFATPEIRLHCPDERKPEVLRAVFDEVRGYDKIVDSTDGLRVTEDEGWWLLRASGTEPKLTARCEARNAEALARISAQLAERLERFGLEADGLR